jgi:membrane-anchored mycosin MYCP
MFRSGKTARTGNRREHVEFLVALEHAPLVQSVLRGVGATQHHYDHSVDLGLALIVGDFDRTVQRPPSLPDPDDATAALLARLRDHFEQRYASWSPTMGKNRTVGQVTGGGSISHGGGPDPEPVGRGRPRRGSAGLGVTVGVLDTALYPHPDLAGGYVGILGDDVLHAPDLPEGTTQPYAAGHSTFVTGLVLDKAPGATVRVHSVLEPDGEATSWDVARAIVALGRRDVQILNLSLVCYTDDGKPPLGLATAIDRLDPDVLVVACAGNHGDPTLTSLSEDDHRKPSWPAALDDVVAVGSAERERGTAPGGYTLSPFTPRDAVWIDVVTHGEGLQSTYFSGTGVGDPQKKKSKARAEFTGRATWSGTSFSAALVAGRVAAVAAEKKISAREAYQELVDCAIPAPPTSGGVRIPPFLDL